MAPTTSATPPQPPPPPPPGGAPVKKKTSPLVWILVGCLGLFVIGGVIFGVATFFVARKVKDVAGEFVENPVKSSVEMMVRMNPDLELVSTDDEAETMTIRDKKTGEVSTFNWADIQEGKLTFESGGESYTIDGSQAADGQIAIQDESGETTMAMGAGAGEVPSWFPAYHDATEITVLVNASQGGQQSTIWTFKTGDAVADVVSFYEQQLESQGWEVNTSTSDVGGASNGSLDATQESGAKSLNMVVAKSSGGEPAQAMVTYTQGGGG
jgi:hypothetical protein